MYVNIDYLHLFIILKRFEPYGVAYIELVIVISFLPKNHWNAFANVG